MSERAKRIEEAALLVLRWRDTIPPHGGLASDMAFLAAQVALPVGAWATCPRGHENFLKPGDYCPSCAPPPAPGADKGER